MIKYILGLLLIGWNIHMNRRYEEYIINFTLFVSIGFIILGLWEEYVMNLQKNWKKYKYEKIIIKYILGFSFLGWRISDLDAFLEEYFLLIVGVGFIILGLWEEYGDEIKNKLKKFNSAS